MALARDTRIAQSLESLMPLPRLVTGLLQTLKKTTFFLHKQGLIHNCFTRKKCVNFDKSDFATKTAKQDCHASIEARIMYLFLFVPLFKVKVNLPN